MKHLFLIATVVIASLAGCKKSNPTPVLVSSTSNPNANTTVDVNANVQASWDLDGVHYSYVSDGNTVSGSSGSDSEDHDDYTYDTGLYNPAVDTIMYISLSKGKLHQGFPNNPSDSLFKAFFPIGAIPYSVNSVNGMDIVVRDNAGVYWYSDKGTANQSGSTLNIVQKKDDPDFAGEYYLKTYITFSCKVYNDAGAMKTITNGKYVGHFGNF